MEGAEGLGLDGRSWFDDADRPGRRLSIRVHAGSGRLSLSLWDGASCRGTFHLAVDDVPALVDDLGAAGLAGASAGRSHETESPTRTGTVPPFVPLRLVDSPGPENPAS